MLTTGKEEKEDRSAYSSTNANTISRIHANGNCIYHNIISITNNFLIKKKKGKKKMADKLCKAFKLKYEEIFPVCLPKKDLRLAHLLF
jgi:predicted N-formylglutamate amidohydrolase